MAGVAGCGDDDSEAAGAAGPTTVVSAAAADTTGTVTIEHAFGSTTIDGRPERIVSLGVQWTDVLLAMGVQPVGVLEDKLAGPSGRYPWQGELSADAATLPYGDALPLEQIAALKPDLIVATYVAVEEASYEQLAAIAPTIGLLGDRQVDRWQDQAEVAGRFLGEPQQAQQLIDDFDQLIADTKAALPGLSGKSFALANFIPGDQIVVVADPDDGASVLFQDLGLQIDPEILAVADGISGRAQLSLEQTGLLDADLLVIFSNGADPSDLVGYDELRPVVNGSAVELDYAAVVGLNTPTPLSIPYSLDLIRPALDVLGAQS